MKLNMNISEKDKRLLMVATAILLLVCSYFFIFNKNMAMANEVKESNKVLQNEVNELKQLETKTETFKKAIETNDAYMKEKLAMFPSDITLEKAIMVAKKLEGDTASTMNSISFAMNSTFYDAAPIDPNQPADQAEQQAQQPAGGTAAVPQDQQSETFKQKLTVNKSDLSVSYSTSYEGFKKIIEFVKTNPERMSVDQISAGFDSSTGLLSGTMTLSLYTMPGSAVEYQAPEIPNVKIGLDRLFNTVGN